MLYQIHRRYKRGTYFIFPIKFTDGDICHNKYNYDVWDLQLKKSFYNSMNTVRGSAHCQEIPGTVTGAYKFVCLRQVKICYKFIIL